jgi:transcriptional regulator with XRE-family HTH domain
MKKILNFSERLKEIRKLSGKTQVEVSNGIGVTEQNYQVYERGKSLPSLQNAIALADFFNVSLDYLVGRDFPLES